MLKKSYQDTRKLYKDIAETVIQARLDRAPWWKRRLLRKIIKPTEKK